MLVLRSYSGTAQDVPDLASEGTVGLKVAVLGGDLDLLAHLFGDRDQVDRWRGNNDLCVQLFLSLCNT